MIEAATDPAERLARLRLIRSENVGPTTWGRLLGRFGTARAALDALPDLAARAGRKRLRIATPSEAEREWALLDRLGGHWLIAGDADYPARLAATEDAPPVIAVIGDVARLSAPSLAVVGARNASSNGRTLCRRLCQQVGAAGFTIVSGLARGIDAEAHRASLATGTVGVVAGGVDVVYPPENAELQRLIGEQGAVVAESAMGAQPMARHFPRRNRVIAGLSLGVLVVEAALRSGSLITARMANDYGRDVFAVPGSPLDPRARGANRLIREGARLVEDADDILDDLAPALARPRGAAEAAAILLPAPAPVSFDDADRARDLLLEALAVEPTDADSLIRATGLDSAAFAAGMLELELAGLVERHAGNRYALSAGDSGH
ncbi:MAG: DNA-processing protein DprA [Pseudomonadota bacterium]|nr:DNA-processing protein DprA [Pseudomonadota bacterium]